jgi:hypothetical protein
MMKGFFGIGQILVLGAAIFLFGYSILGVTTTGISCGASGLKDCSKLPPISLGGIP